MHFRCCFSIIITFLFTKTIKQLIKQLKFLVLFNVWYCVKRFPLWRGIKQNLHKYLDSLLFPWAAQTLQALVGNFFFPLAGIHVGSCCFISPDNLSGGSLRGALLAPTGEGLDRFVSGSGEHSLLSSVIQSLATDSRNCLYFIFACGLRTLYTLNELKSPQSKGTAQLFCPFHRFP